eukprot:Gb_08585 [translate_table: standard]
MSLEIFEDIKSENAKEMTTKDKVGKWTSSMASPLTTERRQLSDISNTGVPHVSSWTNQENNCSAQLNISNVIHLHKEIGSLKKLLATNEATIETQNNEIQKLWFNWCLASQQNRELIQSNAQLFRELSIDREKLKLLVHEYNQMSAMYKVKIVELEQKVTDLSQELQGMQDTRSKESGQNQDIEQAPPKRAFSKQSRNSSSRKSGDSSNEEDSYVKKNGSENEDNISGKRICLRRRSDNVNYKEPSLHAKLRQEDEIVPLVPISSRSHWCTGSFSGQGAEEKGCDKDVTCLPQSDMMLENGPASKKSSSGVQNGILCPMGVDQTSDVKQQQHQQAEHASMSSLNAVIEESQLSRRSSTGRPVRKVTETVASYKEIPLKTKLRRSE